MFKQNSKTTFLSKSLRATLRCLAGRMWNAGRTLPWYQFHQHFMLAFCANIFAQKNYKAKTQLEKSYSKHFCMKHLHVKCWWNWLQAWFRWCPFGSKPQISSLTFIYVQYNKYLWIQIKIEQINLSCQPNRSTLVICTAAQS